MRCNSTGMMTLTRSASYTYMYIHMMRVCVCVFVCACLRVCMQVSVCACRQSEGRKLLLRAGFNFFLFFLASAPQALLLTIAKGFQPCVFFFPSSFIFFRALNGVPGAHNLHANIRQEEEFFNVFNFFLPPSFSAAL